MVSPELLRRFPFFGFMSQPQLNAVAMITNEVTFTQGDTILEHGREAAALYLVIEGNVELYYIVTIENNPDYHKEYFVSEINPGEIFGISALIDPYIYTGNMKAGTDCRVLQTNAPSLRSLCHVDAKLAHGLMTEIAKAAMQRLADTRVLLVSARK